MKPIGQRLKEIRKEKGFKAIEASRFLNVPQSTFATWESGKTEPNIETVMKLCEFYGVAGDILGALGFDGYNENGSIRLNMTECQLVENFRKLSTYNKETLLMLSERLLAGGGKAPEKKIARPVYDLPASAGNGAFLDSSRYSMIEFPENVVPDEATFCIRVSGDSMEPEYPDQSIVFVKHMKNLRAGDVGVFTLNNEGFIKVLGNDRNLISINPDYSDIHIGEYDDLRTVGKVVGEPYLEK